MPKFTDAQGDEWTLRLTRDRALELRDEYDFDPFAEDAIDRLMRDPLVAIDATWVLCKPEAASKQMGRQTFQDNVAGGPLESATFAVIEAIANFYGGQKQKALLVVLETAKEQVKKSDEEVKAAISAAMSPQTESGEPSTNSSV